MFVSQPVIYEKAKRLAVHNLIKISTGALAATHGTDFSTPRDVELHGADYIAWYHDLAGRGILTIVLGFDQIHGSNWIERWSEQYEREVAKLRAA